MIRTRYWRSGFSSVLLILNLLSTGISQSADSNQMVKSVGPDTLLPADAYLDWVQRFHPIVRQANLLAAQAQAGIQSARGAFDPKLYADWEQKSFDGKSYFRVGEGGVKLPSWYGLEFKGTYQVSNGVFLNPQNNLPAQGQAVLGIKASLGQGLIIDERRATLEQARLLEQMNEAERRRLTNDILIDAAEAYWNWTFTYNQMLIYEQALAIANTRLDGIRESYFLGDKPAIDTLETMIQVQDRQFELNQARLNYRNATLQLSGFLWDENSVPLEISDQLRPPVLAGLTQPPVPALEEYLQLLVLNHPELRAYQVKLRQLDVQRRLAAEQLKPQLDVEYNFLGQGTDFFNPVNAETAAFQDLFTQNYKWGLQFRFPLLLRKERGKLEETKIKILQADFQLQQKQLDLANKVRQYFNDLINVRQQIDLFTDMVANYRRLLDAENRKFEIGESSIFLINSREQKLFEAQFKLAKLQAEFQKIRMGLEWAAGRLGE